MPRKQTPQRRLSSEERRQTILDASVPLFARDGVRGVTTKQVAREAGVSEALLYQHFPSKEALYAEVQDHCCRVPEALRTALEALVPSTGTLVLLLYFLVRMVI